MSKRNLRRKFPSSKWLAAVALVVASLFSVSTMVFAQERSGGHVTPSGAKQPDTASVIAPFRTYSCGVGFTFVRFDIGSGGNLIGLQSGSTTDVINTGSVRTGYEVCYTHPIFGFTEGHDLGDSGTVNMGAPAVSSGCVGSRFPCEITRSGPFGELSILRRITGNSFVGPAPANGTFDSIAGGGNGNGIGCDTLGECSNCSNRTLHIITRVTNTSGVSLSGVAYQEIIDFDMAGIPAEIMTRTSSAMTAVTGSGSEDSRKGALMQSLIIDPLTDAYFFLDTPLNCDSSFGETTPTASGDYEARVLQTFGTLGIGANTGNNFRIHVRAF